VEEAGSNCTHLETLTYIPIQARPWLHLRASKCWLWLWGVGLSPLLWSDRVYSRHKS